MSKRKFDDTVESEEADRDDAGLSHLVKRQRHHLSALIEDCSTQIFHALRFARGFERQKLGRRQKSARRRHKSSGDGSNDDNDDEDDGESQRLEAEVAELKKLQLAELADVYLCRQLARTKPIAEHEAFPRAVARRAASVLPKTAAYVNVTSRLYKSNPVMKAMDRAMTEIRSSLGLREEEVRVKKKRVRKADYEATNSRIDTANGEAGVDSTKDSSIPGEGEPDQPLDQDMDEDEFNGFDDSPVSDRDYGPPQSSVDGLENGTGKEEGGYDSEDFDDNKFKQYYARIGSSSDSEEGSIENGDLIAGLKTNGNAQAMDAASISDSELSNRGQSPPLRRTGARTAIDSTKSAFLPSLNTGYISGSESDASDASALAPPRKNRMGQRARREMWERKYGNKANHLQTEGRSVKDRDRGWDLKRGAQDYGRGGHRRGRGGRGGRGDFSGRPGPRNHDRGDQTIATVEKKEKVPQKTPTYGKEHPSWIAKQVAKEKLSALAKPAGKKITFD